MTVQDFLYDRFANGFSVVLGVLVTVSTFFTLLLLFLPKQYDIYEDRPPASASDDSERDDTVGKDGNRRERWKPGKTVHIVVLGDIGRSPRMQYHALSIAKHGGRVFLVGYQESEPHPLILSHPNIHVHPLSPPLKTHTTLLLPLKALHQSLTLLYTLSYGLPPAHFALLQNPPSIPTLAIAALVCFLRNTRLLIDWHNFGHSILALRLGPRHALVRIAEAYEKTCGRLAHSGFCVTDAMKRVLARDYGVRATTLHDRPAALFRPFSPTERTEFLARCPDTAPYARHLTSGAPEQWKLLVSSTSWTPDEDFSVLLDALVRYCTTAKTHPEKNLPHILAVITGKGPLKPHYLARITDLENAGKLGYVKVTTAWLSAEDYAALLASAHLGVSLHTSSSGVDLPMKVVDMFGAGLPVLGWSRFEAWGELVQEGVNGRGFGGAGELGLLLEEVLGEKEANEQSRGVASGKGETQLQRLRKGAVKESGRRWDDEWDRVAGPIFGLT